MYTDFMTTHIFFDEDIRKLDGTRAHDEESSTNIIWTEVIKQFPKHNKSVYANLYIAQTITNWAKK